MPTFPTVHLNGTGKRGLTLQYARVASALRTAIDVTAQNGPHGRDYYVQPGEAFLHARKEHQERLDRLREVLGEIDEILEHVDNQAGA